MRPSAARTALAACLVASLAGCLPSSQRELDRDVSAADSASTAFAATVPTDTLAVVWTAGVPDDAPMRLPTTLAWTGDTLAVVETGDGSVRRFSDAGRYLDATALPAEGFPYLAGVRGDTVIVLARGPAEIWWAVPGRGVVRRAPAPAGASAAVAGPGRLAVRVGGGPGGERPAVVEVDDRGRALSRTPLPGAPWRSVGFLRLWGDSLLALSGYRPVLDVVRGGQADTLALVGFDSPQFVRSAQFARGDVDEPPLLASSAAALGDRLFVLNQRGDHVRVDVYGRDGRLRRALVSPGPLDPVQPVALDLAVRPSAGDRQRGGVEIAVLRSHPPGVLRASSSEVVLYRWRPPPAGPVPPAAVGPSP